MAEFLMPTVGESGSASINFTDLEPEGNFTDTLICAERNINVQDSTRLLYSLALTNTLRALRVIFFTFVLVSGIFLNSAVLVLVAKFKNLQTLSFGIALQVVLSNLLFGIFIHLPIVVTGFADQWLIGEHMCVLVGFVSLCAGIIRMLLMFVIVMDRFSSVFFPFSYPKRRVKITVGLSAFSWLFVITGNVFALPGILDCYTFIPSVQYCYISTTCNSSCFLFGNVYVILIGIPSTIVPIFLYGMLFWKAKQFRRAIRAQRVGFVPDSDEFNKREWRATINFFLLFVSLFALLIPTTIGSVAISQAFSNGVIPLGWYIVQLACDSLPTLLAITDPIIIMRHTDVRENISKLKASLIQRCRRV